jgi:hypothetical protein
MSMALPQLPVCSILLSFKKYFQFEPASRGARADGSSKVARMAGFAVRVISVAVNATVP